MMRGHVFIVNNQTLPIHLRYLFVGTSSGGRDNNISLLADMLRVKTGDFVFFYIEGWGNNKGRFFGVFKAVDEVVQHLTGDDASQPDLPVKLVYRKRIAPYKVYPKGVLEWEALDKLPTYAKELLWSLIYRKMKGTRGNTMLFPWETERLISLIECENGGATIDCQHYTVKSDSFVICEGSDTSDFNMGMPITVPSQDIHKNESTFQAFIAGQLTLSPNKFLPEIFGRNIIWIGNEVFAGSGMQKIDIITVEQTDETSYLYRLIELKHPKSTTNVLYAPSQLEYYVKWAREDIGGHILGSKKFNIKPVVVSLTPVPDSVCSEFARLNEISCSPEIWEIDDSLKTKKVL